MAITLPIFNPNLITIGNFGIRYYSLAYMFGIFFAWLLIKKFSKYQNVLDLNDKKISDDFFCYAIVYSLTNRIIFRKNSKFYKFRIIWKTNKCTLGNDFSIFRYATKTSKPII